MSKLPMNWTLGQLSQAAHVVRGITFPAGEKQSDFAHGYVCCLRTTNVQQTLEWDDVYYVPTNYVKRDDQIVREGDVLMSMANSYELVGKVARADSVPQRAAFGAFLAAVRPTPVIDGGYLYQFLRSSEAQSKLREGSSQTTNIANISAGRLSELPVPLAPLNEQKRIADKLDTVLTRVDAVNTRLARVAPLLKRLRQSVLAAATSGRLTDDWRIERNLPEWTSDCVGNLVKRVEAGLNVRCIERPPVNDERGLVKISAVTWGRFDEAQSKTLPASTEVQESVRIKVGDFLISRANTLELVGACVIVHEVNRRLYLSDKVLRLQLSDQLKPWLLIVLRSDIGRKQIEALASGNQLSMRNLSQSNLKAIRVPLPSSAEVTEIVRRVETLFAFADRLEARLQAAQTAADRLTPSLLSKAFRGELVPQDPNDEHASELLKQLAAAPATLTRKRRSKTTS